MIKFENNLYRILVDTGATHSYVGKDLLEKILSLNHPISKPTSQSLIVANGETVEIIGQVMISITIGKKVKHVSFRLVPKLKSTSILGTDIIKNLKMTLDYDTGSWWLPGSPTTRYQIEARPHSLRKPIIESVASDKKKAIKINKEDAYEIIENRINGDNKILTRVNNQIKSGMKYVENNNKELKPKFGGEIILKSETEYGKIMVGKNPNDFTQKYKDSNLSRKAKHVQNPKINPYKGIPSMFSIPIYNRFQILENRTLQTQDSNENQENEETLTTTFFYISKLPE